MRSNLFDVITLFSSGAVTNETYTGKLPAIAAAIAERDTGECREVKVQDMLGRVVWEWRQ